MEDLPNLPNYLIIKLNCLLCYISIVINFMRDTLEQTQISCHLILVFKYQCSNLCCFIKGSLTPIFLSLLAVLPCVCESGWLRSMTASQQRSHSSSTHLLPMTSSELASYLPALLLPLPQWNERNLHHCFQSENRHFFCIMFN